MMKQAKLGDTVKDTISGFEGIVTAKTEYLDGSSSCAVHAKALHEGQPIPVAWFPTSQLLVKEA